MRRCPAKYQLRHQRYGGRRVFGQLPQRAGSRRFELRNYSDCGRIPVAGLRPRAERRRELEIGLFYTGKRVFLPNQC